MTQSQKSSLIMAVCVVVSAACSIWIYRTQFHAAKFNVGLHQRTGEVLAEQTAKLLEGKGKVITIAIELKEWPELKTQINAFEATLKKLGNFEVREYVLDTKDQPKYSVGSGLSGRRYVRIVNKNTNADVFVSFIGAPNLKKEDLAELSVKPKFVVEARSTDNLAKLFEKNLVSVAVVSRFQFPAPVAKGPKNADAWFIEHYQIVTPAEASALPTPQPAAE